MTLIVAAHPDDEIIGAGAQLPRLSQAYFLHLTDGAPKDMRDASALGFVTREAYAEARRREFFEAFFGKIFARLKMARADAIQSDFQNFFTRFRRDSHRDRLGRNLGRWRQWHGLRGRRRSAQQRSQTPAQCWFRHRTRV